MRQFLSFHARSPRESPFRRRGAKSFLSQNAGETFASRGCMQLDPIGFEDFRQGVAVRLDRTRHGRIAMFRGPATRAEVEGEHPKKRLVAIARFDEQDISAKLRVLPVLLEPGGLFILGHTKRDTLEFPEPWEQKKMLKQK